jgi:hypothetical protein
MIWGSSPFLRRMLELDGKPSERWGLGSGDNLARRRLQRIVERFSQHDE